MRKQNLLIIAILVTSTLFYSSCKKEVGKEEPLSQVQAVDATSTQSANGTSAYNLEVVLQGDKNNNGHIHFRQNRSVTVGILFRAFGQITSCGVRIIR